MRGITRQMRPWTAKRRPAAIVSGLYLMSLRSFPVDQRFEMKRE